jgi:hypothetical protein
MLRRSAFALLTRLTVIAALAAAPTFAEAASARAGLPRLYSTSVLHGETVVNVFKVRPRIAVTDSADGGELVIHWRSWTATRAVGTGRAHPDHGSYPISVTASRPVSGYFTRLTVTGKTGAVWHPDPLGLGYLGGISLTWINLSWMNNPESGSTPWPG